MHNNDKRAPKYCAVCGTQLYRDFYYSGRCAQHQTSKAADRKLTTAAVAAKCHGMSYGQYMAAKREGRL